MTTVYDYVGPPEIREALDGLGTGALVRSCHELEAWLGEQEDWADGRITVTYVVPLEGGLRVAPQRSEHVACASGAAVLAAGELTFQLEPRLEVVAASNLSTGYCPKPECWESVASVLAMLGVPAPTDLSTSYVFRRCPQCCERNLVKEAWFACSCCGTDLPRSRNFGE
jgi:hypothetical protein